MFVVTNIDKTVQRLFDKNGKVIYLEPGKSVMMISPPDESYIFKVEEKRKVEQKKKIKEGI